MAILSSFVENFVQPDMNRIDNTKVSTGQCPPVGMVQIGNQNYSFMHGDWLFAWRGTLGMAFKVNTTELWLITRDFNWFVNHKNQPINWNSSIDNIIPRLALIITNNLHQVAEQVIKLLDTRNRFLIDENRIDECRLDECTKTSAG